FVGPAGRILDKGLERAGIAREDVYITNAVKHFRYKMRGKRRIHQKPDRWQVTACLPWLEAELQMVKPQAVVLLGAPAAEALVGQLRDGTGRIAAGGLGMTYPLPSPAGGGEAAADRPAPAHPQVIGPAQQTLDALVLDLGASDRSHHLRRVRVQVLAAAGGET